MVAQYGNYDGYPEGQGVALVKFLQRPMSIQQLKDGLEHTYEPPESEVLEAQGQISNLRGLEKVAWMAFVRLRDPLLTAEIMEFLRPSLHGDTGADILEVIAKARVDEKVPVQLQLSFANDGLFCEWAYIVDLDAEVLEVFGGAVKKKPGHRFERIGGDDDTVPSFISSFTFSELQRMDESGQKFLDKVRSKNNINVRIFRSRIGRHCADKI
jgi:hypothetical protein